MIELMLNVSSVIFVSPSRLQEGDRAISASPEAGVLCETGHEGHPHRPAHDLHASYRLYGQFHEKVSRHTSL